MTLISAVAACAAGCSSGPSPTSPPPPAVSPAPRRETGFTKIVAGSADSVGAIPGSKGALYVYIFRQVEPGSDRFTFLDRDLSFYFRPAPDALFFQVENRQDRPVWIEWDRSSFTDPLGRTSKIANAETRWDQRLGTLPAVQIVGLQRYSNYLFPIDYLLDPAGSDQQLHRALLPEDVSAPQFSGREFSVTLMFRLSDRMQPYTFRFRVESVIPK